MFATDDPLAIGMASIMQGISLQISGRYAEAVDLHEQALARFQQTGYTAWIVQSMFELGDCLLLSGEIDRARDIIEHGIELAGNVGSPVEMVYGLLYLGFAELIHGNLKAAAAVFAGGLDQAVGHRIGRVSLSCIGGMAGVARTQGNPELAACLLGAVDEARQSIGIRVLVDQSLLDEIAHSVRSDLGGERDAALRREGARLTFEQVLELVYGIALGLAGKPDPPFPAAIRELNTDSNTEFG